MSTTYDPTMEALKNAEQALTSVATNETIESKYTRADVANAISSVRAEIKRRLSAMSEV